MNSSIFHLQDTISPGLSDSISVQSQVNDSSGSLKKFSAQEVVDIFRAMEQRERERDSVARVRANYATLRSIEQKRSGEFDTAAIPYNFKYADPAPPQHPLVHFNKHYFSLKDTMKPVFLEQYAAGGSHGITEFVPDRTVPSAQSQVQRPDWLLVIIIGSLVLLAWLKLFYNKFLDQTMQSVANFQLSTKLLRDQNIFSRRVAFLLNVNFIVVGAAYLYLVFGFFHINPFPLSDILSFLVYTGILSGLLMIRFLISRSLGHIFNRQYEFSEYLHQLLLIYKNLGIYLLVIVIGIAYIREDFRIYIVYFSGFLLISAFIMRFYKGLKIILNNKDVLIFYLILYLCTLEILPILLFYKFFSSSVLTGQV